MRRYQHYQYHGTASPARQDMQTVLKSRLDGFHSENLHQDDSDAGHGGVPDGDGKSPAIVTFKG